MKITIVSFAMAAAFGLIACDNTKHNTLTEQEKAEGWELLFDGETLDGWRDYNGTALTGPWEVVNGETSNKVRKSFDINKKKGLHVGSSVPYGYRKKS